MIVVRSQQVFTEFVEFVAGLDEDAAPGLSFRDLAKYIRDHETRVLPLFYQVSGLTPEPTAGITAPPPGENYERWDEPKRRAANVNALRALRQMQGEGRSIPTPEERLAMLAFTGWGGIQVSELPADSTLFPPEYVKAIEEFRSVREKGIDEAGWRIPTSNVFSGLQHQYFTPLSACRAMWALARRVSRYPLEVGLEPSAGIGRFLLSVPCDESMVWTAVENDPLLTEFLRALHPSASIYSGEFERFFTESQENTTFRQPDLILSNPPYDKNRPPSHRALDPQGNYWQRADTYFTERSMRLLRPGGIFVTVTPLSQINGEKEAMELRRLLTKMGWFLGAVIVPDSLFPNVSLNIAIHAWVRGVPGVEYERMQPDVVSGTYFETPEGMRNVLGEWKQGRFGFQVHGPFDARRVIEMAVHEPPSSFYDDLDAWRRDNPPTSLARPRISCPIRPPVAPSAPAPTVPTVPATPDEVDKAQRAAVLTINAAASGVVEQAKALSFRIKQFQSRASVTPAEAEVGRQELLRDVRTFILTHGNPHHVPALESEKRFITGLLAVVQPDGQIAPVLSHAITTVTTVGLPGGASDEEIVEWYSRRYGVCTETDLERHNAQIGAFDRMVDSDTIAIEPKPDGTVNYYSVDFSETPDPLRDVYAAGDLYSRLEMVNAALEGEPGQDPRVRAKLDRQKAKLITTIDPKTISDIEITPRSGFVIFPAEENPYQLLQDYINDVLKRTHAYGGEPLTLFDDFGILRVKVPEHAVITVAGTRFAEDFIAYYNRSLQAPDLREEEGKQRNRFDAGADIGTRQNLEKDLESEFSQWVMLSDKWREKVEITYNMMNRSFRPREYDGSPLVSTRINPEWVPKLHPHQNAAVRRIMDRGSAIIAHDVGLGKTFIGLAACAMMRQEGRISKPVILAPNSVVPKWYKDARDLLPDYRVCVIGWTPTKVSELQPDGSYRDVQRLREDTHDEREMKWRRFAAGGYDLAICPYSKFVDDTALSDDGLLTVLSEVEWIRRGKGKESADKRLTERRIKEAKDKLVELRSNAPRPWEGATKQERHEARIVRLEAQIEAWEADMKAPSNSVIEQIRRDVEQKTHNKPFRPRRKLLREWSASMSLPELLAYARSKGLDLEYDPDNLRADGKPKKRSKPSVVAALEQFFPQKRVGEEPVPPMLTWEEVGCDFLIVDEAHNFKNLWGFKSSWGEDKIEFMGTPGEGITIQTWDLYTKALHLIRNQDDTGVVLLTATPLKNSPIEVYNLLSHISRRVWTTRNIRSINDFIQRHCRIEVAASFTTEGEATAPLTMTAFKNLDELCAIYSIYVDKKTLDDVPKLRENVPILANKGETNIAVQMDGAQQSAYIQVREAVKEYVEELEKLIKLEKDPFEKAILVSVRAGMNFRLLDMLAKIAIDPRLLREDIADLEKIIGEQASIAQEWAAWKAAGGTGREPKRPLDVAQVAGLRSRLDILRDAEIERLCKPYDSGDLIPPKYLAVAEKIKEQPACGHIIFSDLNTTHEEIKRTIINTPGLNITEDQIAIIDGSVNAERRQEIAEAFNGKDLKMDAATGFIYQEAMEPKYHVVIGNSRVMGEGLDLQRRTCAIHHLTFPWEPATIHQRNGRGVRQGNIFDKVFIFYYVANKSFDGFKLNMILGKSDWQKTMCEGGENEMANPAAGSMLSREEMMILIFAEDEEEANRLIAGLRLQKEIATQERRRHEAIRLLRSVIAKYASARAQYRRKPEDVVSYQSLMGSADRKAKELMAIPGDPIPNLPSILAAAREATIFYSPRNRLVLPEGARLCLRSSDAADGSKHQKPRLVEIVKVILTGDGAFQFRYFGDYEIRNATRAESVLDASDLHGVVEVAPLESCSGWDDAMDEKKILEHDLGVTQVYTMDRNMVAKLGDRLGDRVIQNALSQSWAYEAAVKLSSSSHPTVLESRENPGQYVLIERDGLRRLLERTEAARKLLAGYRLVLPTEGWVVVSEAIRRDKVQMIEVAWGGVVSYRPIDEERDSRGIGIMALEWFRYGRGIPPSMYEEMRKKRAKAGEKTSEESGEGATPSK